MVFVLNKKFPPDIHVPIYHKMFALHFRTVPTPTVPFLFLAMSQVVMNKYYKTNTFDIVIPNTFQWHVYNAS